MSELKYSIHPSEITLLRKVGGGNFGEVWEADYIGTRVAVKRLLAVDEEDLEIYIERELSTLRYTSRNRSFFQLFVYYANLGKLTRQYLTS
jgi:serine/threonine protein kinase